MYIIVRDDLNSIYKMVQGSHALAQFMLEHTQIANEWNNNTIVFVKTNNEQSLHKWKRRLEIDEKTFSTFYEPDIDNQLTAIACYDDGHIFRNLQLVK